MNNKENRIQKGAVNAPVLMACAVFAVCTAFGARNYPDQSVVTEPQPTPAFPAAFAAFEPNIESIAPASGAPIIAEWTRSNDPGDTLALTGEALSRHTGSAEGRDTRFILFGQSAAAGKIEAEGRIQRLDGRKAAVTLPDTLPADTAWLMWPENDAGFGEPVLINRTEAWWVGPDRVAAGEPIAIHGRNLVADRDHPVSYVYLQQADGSGQWLTSVEANPFKAVFDMPANLSNAAYTLWAHNGVGGRYGWSDPVGVTIVNEVNYDGPVINVSDYGAKGDGVTDDWSAIRSALSAARGMTRPTVYFPAGTYLISASLHDAKYDMHLQGAGMGQTTIKAHPNYGSNTSYNYGLFFCRKQPGPSKYSDMTISSGGHMGGSSIGETLIYMQGGGNAVFENVRFSQLENADRLSHSPILDMGSSSYVTFRNCEFILAGSVDVNENSRQIFFEGCTFKGINDNEFMINAGASRECSVTDCLAMNYDNSDPNDGHGWAQGRFFYASGSNGRVGAIYYSGNATSNLTVRATYSANQNTGEQFMTEFGRTEKRARPTAVTASSVTFSSLAEDYTDLIVAVVGGKGIGQHRLIESVSGSTVNLEKPWRVVPDTDSIIMIGEFARRHVVYNNSFDGVERAVVTDVPSTAGVMPYGSQFEMVVSNNRFHQLKHGISVWHIHNTIGSDIVGRPLYFNLFEDNELIRCRRAVDNSIPVYSGTPTWWDVSLLGNVFRGNTIKGSTEYAFRTRTWVDDYTIDLCVYDSNSTEDYADTHIEEDIGLRNQVWVGNTFSSSRGGTGMDIAGGHVPSLRGNSWNGFSSVYGGSTPGAVLELPCRVQELYTDKLIGSLPVFNAGTAPLNWTASTSSDWLTLSKASGNIGDESGEDLLVFEADPSKISTSTAEAVVTVTANGQQQQLTVEYAATTAPPPPDGPPPPVLTELSISGPVSLDEQSAADYTCTGTYSDGTTAFVDAVWSENSASASINADGLLSAGDVSADTDVALTAEYNGFTATYSVQILYVEPVVTGLSISGPSELDEETSATLTCAAFYSDGSIKTVQPVWGTDSLFATMNAAGVLSVGNVTADETVSVTAAFGGKTASHEVVIRYVAPTLTGLTIIGTSGMDEGTTASYFCVGLYSDGTTAVVAPNWSENSTYASISSSGALTAGNVSSDQTVTITATAGGFSDTQTVLIRYVAPVLSGISISGPSEIEEETSASYSCTALYSDGSTQAVTPSWSVDGSHASVSTAGALSVGNITADETVTLTAAYSGKTATFAVTVRYEEPVLTGLEVSGPTQVDADSAAQYSCTALYSDGTSVSVPATWSENSSYTTIDSSGRLTADNVPSDQFLSVTATHGGQSASLGIQIRYVEPPLTLSSISVSGPDHMDENSSIGLTCTAHYSDGTSEAVNAGWLITSGTGSISTDGTLQVGNVDADSFVTVQASFEGETAQHSVAVYSVGSLIVYPLSGYDGEQVRAELWDEVAGQWYDLGAMNSPDELVLEELQPDQWYRLVLRVYDAASGNWVVDHSNWISM